MATARLHARTSYLPLLVGLVLVIGILYLAKPVLVPLALAILLTFILSPLVMIVQGWGLKRVYAVLVVVVVALLIFAAVGWIVAAQVSKLARELPTHKQEIKEKIASIRGSGDSAFPKLFQMIREIGEEREEIIPPADGTPPERPMVVAAPESSGLERLSSTVAPVLEPLATAGLVVILVIFMLTKREDLRNRLIGLLGRGHLTGTTRVIVDAAERLSRFLLNQVFVNAGFGILFGIGLLVIGVPYAFLWGFLATVLRFVPYIGSWLAVAFPLILSFAISPGWGQPIAVLAYFACLDVLTASVVEPLLFGHSTGVTPIALLVAAAFWAWLWGPIGLILSTPLTVCLVVLGQHVPRFSFLTVLMGDEPALDPHVSYYQRLLAKDRAEAAALAVEHAHLQGCDKAYDEVLLPALVLARRERKHAGLTAEDEGVIFQETRVIIDTLAAQVQPSAASHGLTTIRAEDQNEHGSTCPAEHVSENSAASRVLILGSPAHNEAEELSLRMLAQMVQPDGCQMEVLSTRALPVEVEQRIAQENPALVFIAVLPPGGLVQARYLCRRLRKRFADLPIIIGYWGTTRDFDQLLIRLRSAGASYVTTSLLQSRSQIQALVKPTAPVQTPTSRLQPAGVH